MRYGMGYKGSKNSIAEWIISELPRAETFVDLFFGGGAVTHAALISGKYKNFIANDIAENANKADLDDENIIEVVLDESTQTIVEDSGQIS